VTAGETTQPTEPTPEPIQPASDFERCARCQMEIRRTEMEFHLGHAHNVGPVREKDKKERRGRGRPSRS
jgi:hypothetical protein